MGIAPINHNYVAGNQVYNRKSVEYVQGLMNKDISQWNGKLLPPLPADPTDDDQEEEIDPIVDPIVVPIVHPEDDDDQQEKRPQPQPKPMDDPTETKKRVKIPEKEQ